MLRSRIIPCLLISSGGLVKTLGFSSPKYVGDPLNAVRIFNEKGVDELIVVDIDATVAERAPNFALIELLAAECRMPLCYGGGVRNLEQVKRLVGLGVEKVAIGSAAVQNPELITDAARSVGSQSVLVVVDVKKTGAFRGRYEVFVNNGSINTQLDPVSFSTRAEALGAGEILLNSIDRDGSGIGYDTTLIDSIHNVISVPLTVLGGAGSYDDFAAMVKRYKLLGLAAGSVFVFSGKYKAVLIQYPSMKEFESIFLEN